ncbi:hypothetical protein NW752_010541 [Fusarium irregulare]|nr:hypothetical protein NW752_010541 [Fusarium irregulare]
MKFLLWLTAAHVAQAAGRHGRMKKRQAIEAEVDGAVNAAKLRLSYITETTTERVTETQIRTILQTPAAIAPAAAEAVTVTINAEPVTVTETKTEVVNQVDTQYVTQVQVETQFVTQVDVQIVTEVAPPLPAVTIKEPITVIEVEPLTIHSVITETVNIPGEAPLPVTVTVPGEAPAAVTVTVPGGEPDAITIIHTVEAPQAPSAPVGQAPGPGVTTIPIPESALPKTTLASDPYAVTGPIRTESITPKLPTSALDAPIAGPSTSPADQPVVQPAPAPPTSAAEEPVAQPSTTAIEQPVVQPSTTAVEQPATTSAEEPAAEPTSSQAEPSAEPTPTQEEPQEEKPTMSPSMELGNMGPDTTGAIAAPILDGTSPTTTGKAPSQTRTPVDLSDPSKLSSVLDLGNLGGGSGPLKARATGSP